MLYLQHVSAAIISIALSVVVVAQDKTEYQRDSEAEKAAKSYVEFLEGSTWATEGRDGIRATRQLPRYPKEQNTHDRYLNLFGSNSWNSGTFSCGDWSLSYTRFDFDRKQQKIEFGNIFSSMGDPPLIGEISQPSPGVWEFSWSGFGGETAILLLSPNYYGEEWLSRSTEWRGKKWYRWDSSIQCKVRVTRLNDDSFKEEIYDLKFDDTEREPSTTVWKRSKANSKDKKSEGAGRN